MRPAATDPHGGSHLSEAGREEGLVRLEALTVDATGAVGSNGSHTQLHRYRPGDPDNLWWWPQALRALGRGLSADAGHVDAVETLPGGLLGVDATGRFASGAEGRWRLVVDPAHGHLVRSARFVPQGSATPLVSVESAGTVAAGDLRLAAVGVLRYHAPRGGLWELRAEVRELAAEASSGLLASVRAEMGASRNTVEETIDYTVTPPLRSFRPE